MTEHVFGIDLGTTYSAIAWMNDGRPEVIRNREGQETTPSVVYFENAENFVVGREAKNGAEVFPDETVLLIKRSMGEKSPMEFHGTTYYPETISAIILKDLVDYARDETGIDTNKVVITVPAYFGLVEKEATRQAGEIAGLDVIGIVTEPVAAALSAGIRGTDSKTLFVYDLGGGTFDCTVMAVTPDAVDVIVADGDRKLGGADWDDALFQLVVDKFQAQAGLTEDPTDDEDFSQKLRTEVEYCKIALSNKERATIKCSFADAREIIEITRAEFENVTAHLVEETLKTVERAMKRAQEDRPGITYDDILLVGGSARMPMIERALRERFGWEPTRTKFDLAVALGAAIYGQGAEGWANSSAAPARNQDEGQSGTTTTADGERRLLLGGREVRISNNLSRGLGLMFVREHTREPYIGFLVHAQQSLPLPEPVRVAAQTVGERATEIAIHVYEQAGEAESEVVEHNREITPEAGSVFTDLPNLPAGSPIDIELNIDAEGLYTLSAFEPESGQRLTLSEPLSVMSPDEQQTATAIVAGLSRRED